MKRPKRSSVPDIPADDSIGPALMTSRRLASQIEAIAGEVAWAQHRLQRLGAYVDHSGFTTIANDLAIAGGRLAELGGQVLVGKVPIAAGRDEAAGRERYPLLEGIPPAPGTNGRGGEEEGWEATPVEALELPAGVEEYFRKVGIKNAGSLKRWYDMAMTPSEVSRRVRQPNEYRERTLGLVGEVLARLLSEVEGPIERVEAGDMSAPDVRTCRVCGCTDDDCSQCIAKTGEPCSWVEADLCSACAQERPAPADAPAGVSTPAIASPSGRRDRTTIWEVRRNGRLLQPVRADTEDEALAEARALYPRSSSLAVKPNGQGPRIPPPSPVTAKRGRKRAGKGAAHA